MTYIWDEELYLFRRSEVEPFAYSDGTEVEERLFSIIRNAQDRSTFSPELSKGITDWPSEYHLSRSRHCLIRPLGIKPGERVLELGCGCGALTRYLGEIGADVMAVEGSIARARIAAERCRDLANVQVVVDDLLRFETEARFDWVLLAGVLEYAPVFSDAIEPVDHYLRTVTRFLAQDGKLVIAIENKLGLKYFNGCSEDHLNVPFLGIQDLYGAKAPRTFGRRELIQKLIGSGLRPCYFYYPFPDYKLPSVVLSDDALKDPQFNAVELIIRSHARDYSGSPYRLFDEALVFSALSANGLLAEFANSFLVVATFPDAHPYSAGRLAMTFAVNRVPEFSAVTSFYRSDDVIRIVKEPVFPERPRQRQFQDGLNILNVPTVSTYYSGRLLLWRLLAVRANKGTLDQVVAELRPWVSYLFQFARSEGAHKPHGIGEDERYNLKNWVISGKYLDCTPFNLIETGQGFVFIDDEWRTDRDIPLGWVITRGVLYSLTVGLAPGNSIKSVSEVVQVLCRVVQLFTTEAEVSSWIDMEARLQSLVTGQALSDIWRWLGRLDSGFISLSQALTDRDAQIAGFSQAVAERDAWIAGFSQAVAERDAQIAGFNQAVGERDRQIAGLNRIAAERERILNALLSSRSWKLTAPLRWGGLQIRRVLRVSRAVPRKIRQAGGVKPAAAKAVVIFRQEGLEGLRRRFRCTPTKESGKSRLNPNFPQRSAGSNKHHSNELPNHQVNVDLIVCVHNALEDVKRCLESVVANTFPPYRLIIIDDGSDIETKEYLENFVVGQPALLIRNEEAIGYTRAANTGLRHSSAEMVVLLNSDTIVPPRWLDRLVRCALSDERIGLVGPLSNTASWQSVPEIFNAQGDWADNSLPDGWSVKDFSNEVASVSNCIFPRVGFLNGFCLLIKRGVIKDIGLFDEITFARGYGEENDYCLRAFQRNWQLAVADDCYVYHAQSKSYSHELRKELANLSGDALAAKHGQKRIDTQLKMTRDHPALEYIRKRCEQIPRLKRLRDEISNRFEGKRVLFLLPAGTAGGGGNIVLLECAAMRACGVDAWIANLAGNRDLFEEHHPDLKVPVLYLHTPEELLEFAPHFDAVIATLYLTVFWLQPLLAREQRPRLGYYIQDFEPDFFPEGSPEYEKAWLSYTAIPDIRLFTKTRWNFSVMQERLGLMPEIIGPSFDIKAYHPAADYRGSLYPVRIAAMVRPSTPRRAPEMTLRVLRRLKQQFQNRIEISIFGARCHDHNFLVLERAFEHQCLGELTAEQVKDVLIESDIFVDCSVFQAMGLTAMESMACGAVVVGPLNGGLTEIVENEHTGLLIDTQQEDQIFSAVARLIENPELRQRMRLAAFDILKHSPILPVYRMLAYLFTEVN